MNALFRMETTEIEEIMDFIRKMPLTATVTVNDREYLLLHSCPPHLYNGKTLTKENVWDFSLWTRVEPDDILITGKEKSESTAEAEIHMKHADSLAFD